MIPLEDLQIAIKIADKCGDGLLFHHTYVNSMGEACTHLTPLNTMPIEPDFIKVAKKRKLI